MDEIRQALSEYSDVLLEGGLAVKEQWEQIVDTLLMIMVVLMAVALIIALIGVANTLSLSVLERRRETATLRAMGMTRKQIRRFLAVESSLVALGILPGWHDSWASCWLGGVLCGFRHPGKSHLPHSLVCEWVDPSCGPPVCGSGQYSSGKTS